VVPPRRFKEPAQHARYLRSLYQGKHLAAPHRFRWLLVALGLGIYTVNFVAGDNGVFSRIEMELELSETVAENADLRLEKDRLVQEIQLKESDPMSLERLAREKYWMIGPDEKIYRFEDDEVVEEMDVAPAGDDEEEVEEP
jgi:cell division protein FtsB